MKVGIESELLFHFSLSNMSLESEYNFQNTEDSLLDFFQLALEVELQRSLRFHLGTAEVQAGTSTNFTPPN